MLVKQQRCFKDLSFHYANIVQKSLPQLYVENKKRLYRFCKEFSGIKIDFSRQFITLKTIQLLLKLAKVRHLPEEIDNLFSGKKINVTEQQSVLHMALRYQGKRPWLLDDRGIMFDIKHVLTKMQLLTEALHSGKYHGFTGKDITDIVCLGTGGSYLGSRMIIEAFTPILPLKINCHFVTNVDPIELEVILKKVNPSTTVFIIISKSFSTHETIYNAKKCRSWICKHLSRQAVAKHFIAVTAKMEKAKAFGIHEENIFPLWEWVCGRFSLWSAVGLPISLAFGMNFFRQLLAGAASVDKHFRTTNFIDNIPVMLGILSIWLVNFCDIHNHAIICYSHQLNYLPAYLQQLEMESNGKQATLFNKKINYHTAPIILGGVGTNVQHSFMQLMHQGTEKISADFIIVEETQAKDKIAQRILEANAIAQAEALVFGFHNKNQPLYRFQPGNQPSTIIKLRSITPYNVGALLAIYEHKVFVEGVIWNIDSFDQWGVKLSKELAELIVKKRQPRI